MAPWPFSPPGAPPAPRSRRWSVSKDGAGPSRTASRRLKTNSVSITTRPAPGTAGTGTSRSSCWPLCESAWNKDPVFGVIGIQTGPRGRRVHNGSHGGHGSRFWDADSGDDCEDPAGLFFPGEADQGDLPRVSGIAEGCAQGDPVAGDRVPVRTRSPTAAAD